MTVAGKPSPRKVLFSNKKSSKAKPERSFWSELLLLPGKGLRLPEKYLGQKEKRRGIWEPRRFPFLTFKETCASTSSPRQRARWTHSASIKLAHFTPPTTPRQSIIFCNFRERPDPSCKSFTDGAKPYRFALPFGFSSDPALLLASVPDLHPANLKAREYKHQPGHQQQCGDSDPGRSRIGHNGKRPF